MINDPAGNNPMSGDPLGAPGMSLPGSDAVFGSGGFGVAGGLDSSGHLGICDYGVQAIDQARNPSLTVVQMAQIRAQLNCPGCVQAFDLELKVKTTLAAAAVEPAPIELQTRISAALESIDLSQIDITDL